MKQRRVLILVDTATTWGGEVIRGIDAYAQAHPQWWLHVETRGELELLSVPAGWKGDGIIARVTAPPLARQLTRLKIPVVNVSWSTVAGHPFAQVTADESAVGRLAARHLLERGFQHFGYCGLPKQQSYVDRCEPAFVDELKRHGQRVDVFAPRGSLRRKWEAVTPESITTWLLSLPKPLGVLAWGAERGRGVTDACRATGLLVPDEVAVLTTADDELLCGISHPPLSAVDERPRVVGFEAAALLHKLMSGRRVPKRAVLIPPLRVVARRSTDVFAVDDHDVSAALRYIREHYVEPIDVATLVKVVPLSRRVLEQRFRRALGRSPAAEIRRVRLARATELLSDTDWPIAQIARSCGFVHVEGMYRVFRRELDETPNGYRNLSRL